MATARAVRFPENQMTEIMQEFIDHVPHALDAVMKSLPTDFSQKVATSIYKNVLRLHGRLSKNAGG
jgi:serine/threonine-protein kinase HipA